MLGKLLCWIVGHKRGKRVGRTADFGGSSVEDAAVFECPRCGATWTRKVYPRKAKP